MNTRQRALPQRNLGKPGLRYESYPPARDV